MVFLEENGILIIEAESTKSRLRDWEKKTSLDDYTGECHLEFTGNKTISGPPESPLKYQFMIQKSGVYQLAIRAHKRLETSRQDISNDCYISMKGDFAAAGSVSLEVLRTENKFFGGHNKVWGWATRLDVKHKKYDALYDFKEGETYTLIIHGRSKNFNIDRILLVHNDISLRKIQNENRPENKQEGTTKEGGKKLKAYTKRSLTSKDGRSVEVKLLSKTKEEVVVLIKGRKHVISLSTLSEEDQDYIKNWKP